MASDAQLALDYFADNFAMLFISSSGTHLLYVNDGLGDRWFRRHSEHLKFVLYENQKRVTPSPRARSSFSTNWTEVRIPDECRRG